MLWEHAYTRSDFATNAIEIVDEDNEVDAKLTKLIKEHQIVWVTRGENNCLTGHGYRSRRPNGWKSAYNECEIKLV